MQLAEVIKQIRPCNPDLPYIFVSYSGHDRELVWRDVLKYQRQGYNVWLDEKNLDKSKASWMDDALAAIEDMECCLVVFYVSETSLCSKACYQEMSKTLDQVTQDLHNGPVKFIAIDAQEIGDITDFKNRIFQSVTADRALEKEERSQKIRTLQAFVRELFNSNNDRVRIHPKEELNRKTDYYEDILAAFPDAARIFENVDEEENRQAEAAEAAAREEERRRQAEAAEAAAREEERRRQAEAAEATAREEERRRQTEAAEAAAREEERRRQAEAAEAAAREEERRQAEETVTAMREEVHRRQAEAADANAREEQRRQEAIVREARLAEVSAPLWTELSAKKYASLDNSIFYFSEANNQTILCVFRQVSNMLYLMAYHVDGNRGNAVYLDQTISVQFDAEGRTRKFDNTPVRIRSAGQNGDVMRVTADGYGGIFVNGMQLRHDPDYVATVMKTAKKPMLSFSKRFY